MISLALSMSEAFSRSKSTIQVISGSLMDQLIIGSMLMMLLGTIILLLSVVLITVCLRVKSSTWPYSPRKSTESPTRKGWKTAMKMLEVKLERESLAAKPMARPAMPAPATMAVTRLL